MNDNARHSVVPIISRLGDTAELRGTGFIVGTERLCLVTAAHSVRHVSADAQLYWLSDRHAEGGSARGVTHRLLQNPRICEKADLAVFDVEPPPWIGPLPLTRRQPYMLDDIYCYEFSPLLAKHHDEETVAVRYQAWSHKGHSPRVFRSGGAVFMNTSFPAVVGASGAPIFMLINRALAVAGMIVQHHGQEIHQERLLAKKVVEEDGTEEWFYLPYGVGLAQPSLCEALESLSVNFYEASESKLD